MKKLILALCLLILGGCMSVWAKECKAKGFQPGTPGFGQCERRVRLVNSPDYRKCRSFGFRPGTDAFASCLHREDIESSRQYDNRMRRTQDLNRAYEEDQRRLQCRYNPMAGC